LCFIGSGQFSKAIDLIESNTEESTRSVVDQFNLSVAQWGATGRVPKGAFETFVTHFSRSNAPRNANERQCLALALGVLGHLELAKAELQAARERINSGQVVFSCWRYLNVTGDEMKEDISDMEARLDRQQPLRPAFLNEVASSRLH
jgi:hypothetical protein